MFKTNSNALASATADAAPTKTAGPRRWWRAVDQFTLDTMNAPIPARVRAAMGGRDATFTEATDFAATVRAAAPGRSRPSTDSHPRSDADFAGAIRAAAPGRQDQR